MATLRFGLLTTEKGDVDERETEDLRASVDSLKKNPLGGGFQIAILLAQVFD